MKTTRPSIWVRISHKTNLIPLAVFLAAVFFIRGGTAIAIPELRPSLELWPPEIRAANELRRVIDRNPKGIWGTGTPMRIAGKTESLIHGLEENMRPIERALVDLRASFTTRGDSYSMEESRAMSRDINRLKLVAYLEDHARSEKLEIGVISINDETKLYSMGQHNEFIEDAMSLALSKPVGAVLPMATGIPICQAGGDSCIEVAFFAEEGSEIAGARQRPPKIEAMFTENGKAIGVAEHLALYDRDVLTSSFASQSGNLCAWLSMTRENPALIDLQIKVSPENRIRVADGTSSKDETRVTGSTTVPTGGG